MTGAAAGPTAGSTGIVPTIDLSGWACGSADARKAIAGAVDAACRSVGFMRIVGHGIPQPAIDGLASAIDDFFAMPSASKRALLPPRPSINRGYTAPRSERLSSSLGLVSPDDLFEAFNVGSQASEFPQLELDRGVYSENIWPSGLPAFEARVATWFDHAGAMARTMTSVFAMALGLAADHFAAFTDHSIDVLRLNHYDVPVGVEVGTDQLGMGAHTDYGIVTILWADAVPGLQILRPDGTWLQVQPAPGALLINLGDLLARWTNDRWRSTMHRVVPSRAADGSLVRRRSAAYFHDGNADAVISTLTPCRDLGGDTYEDVTVAEHLARKLAGSRGLTLNESAHREAARIDPARASS
ncbi:MAG: 2-oxoglutarate and iron-dependent oxygenase domain-containing protein [Ilumatobacteraceae bacterium]